MLGQTSGLWNSENASFYINVSVDGINKKEDTLGIYINLYSPPAEVTYEVTLEHLT